MPLARVLKKIPNGEGKGFKGIKGIRGIRGIKGLKSPPFTFRLLSVISLYFVNNFLGGKDVLGTKVVIFVAIFLIVAICRNVANTTLQQTVSCNHTNTYTGFEKLTLKYEKER